MKEIHSKVKNLRFSALIKELRELYSIIEDNRRKPIYKIEDVIMSMFSMMFFQDESMLKFQEKLREKCNMDNLETMFGVSNVASDNQLRNILDNVDSEEIEKGFNIVFRHLERSKKLEEFKTFNGKYLVAIDGTEYYSSYSHSCEKCLTAGNNGEKTRYYHKALQATLVSPDIDIVIPLLSEEIANTDGDTKQDSENKAAKRLLKRLRKYLPKMDIVILGDGLYSNEPMIELLKEENYSFLLNAKPKNHKGLYAFLRSRETQLKEVEERITINVSKKTQLLRLKKLGKTTKDLKEPEVKKRYYKQCNLTKYRYYNKEDAPINNGYNTFVNYVEVETKDEMTSSIIYKNSWVTNLDINDDNVKKIVRDGRGRWNIENRQFLTTKKGGYELEHNYGHGDKNLSFNFYLLNVLAFLFHQILHLTSNDFNKLKTKEGGFKSMYAVMKYCIRFFVFKTFDEMILFILNDDR